MIIVDTREQKPLWDPAVFNVIKKKLDEGDYTTEDLYNKAHIERKSGIDLYGSIIQGHTRFKKEILRAIDKKIKFAIFVECPEKMFYSKRFTGGYRLKAPSSQLRKIVATMKERYSLEFVWCEDRDDMMDKMCIWFAQANGEIITNMKQKRKEMVKFNG
jgi:ERCC4-type nuclease